MPARGLLPKMGDIPADVLIEVVHNPDRFADRCEQYSQKRLAAETAEEAATVAKLEAEDAEAASIKAKAELDARAAEIATLEAELSTGEGRHAEQALELDEQRKVLAAQEASLKAERGAIDAAASDALVNIKKLLKK
jgi:hypothetical protein